MNENEDGDDFLDFTPVPTVPSPCVAICRMGIDGICEGCGRTLTEIAEWSRASDGRKREILSQVATRR